MRRVRALLHRGSAQRDELSRLGVQGILHSAVLRIVRLELLLHAYDGLVALVEPCGEGDHDVALLEQHGLVPAHLRPALLRLLPVSLQLANLTLVLSLDALLFLPEHSLELVAVAVGGDAAAAEELRLHLVDPLLELAALLLLLEELLAALLELGDGAHLVSLGFPPLFLNLEKRPLVHEVLRPLVEFLSQSLQLALVLSQEGLLVEVLVDSSGVLDVLGSIGKFER